VTALLCCQLSLASPFALHNAPAPSHALDENRIVRTRNPLRLFSSSDKNIDPTLEQEIDKGLEKARALLEKTKAKLLEKEAKRQDSKSSSHNGAAANGFPEEPEVPFFAVAGKRKARTVSREGVVKSRDEKTGLIRADGERMAAISEQEDWEFRTLHEVFENEMKENEDVYSMASQQLASKDVAQSIWNLRKQLQEADYKKIFDTKNHFIGEIE
jgi:hypothetical protein